jgi:ATP-dependent exoDNAse (exonuclease V) alpha subunit
MVDFSKHLKGMRRNSAKAKGKEIMTRIKLTDQQAEAQAIALETRNHLFITGDAGTGKTLLLEEIIRGLRKQNKKVRVASFTGLAALRLRGSTLARLLGTGLAKRVEDLKGEIFERAEENLDKVTDLIVDEISMVSGDYLQMMDKVMRDSTGEDEPFGGIRMIFCGDFMQLPPVRHSRDPEFNYKWSFEHPLFGLAQCVCLTQYMRQGAERDVRILGQLRHGLISVEGREVLDAMVGRELKNPTELYPINRTVHMVNQQRLTALKGRSKTYSTHYSPERFKEHFIGQVPIGEEVTLKEGAPIIILANNPNAGYANGSQGVVTYMDWEQVEVKLTSGRTVEVKRKNWEIEDVKGDMMGVVSGLPIHLGWAATIHRAQGMTLDAVKTDVATCFEPGQAYVAMTRTRSLDDISLTTPVKEFQVDQKALEFTKSLEY